MVTRTFEITPSWHADVRCQMESFMKRTLSTLIGTVVMVTAFTASTADEARISETANPAGAAAEFPIGPDLAKFSAEEIENAFEGKTRQNRSACICRSSNGR